MKNLAAVITLIFSLSACMTHPARELAEQEQAFSDHAQRVGYQQAFVDYFDHDGIALQPHPVPVHQHFARAQRDPNHLQWTPHYSVTSHAGDLGFTAGVWQYRNAQQSVLSTGYFCSSWRHNGQTWRTLIDGGAAAPLTWQQREVRQWQSRGETSPAALPRSGVELSAMSVARDALWHAPQQLPQFGPATSFDFAAIEVTVLREYLSATRDMAVVLYRWQISDTVHYLHTAWHVKNAQWQLQFACFGDAPAP